MKKKLDITKIIIEEVTRASINHNKTQKSNKQDNIRDMEINIT